MPDQGIKEVGAHRPDDHNRRGLRRGQEQIDEAVDVARMLAGPLLVAA
jgi:hypothetical protein